MSEAAEMAGTGGPGGVAATDRRQFLFGGALLALTAAAVVLKPRRSFDPPPEKFLDGAVPQVIGGWRYVTASGLIVPPEDELSSRLYDQVLTRVYENADGLQLGLLIAYGSAQNASLQLHRPENCYPPQGFTLGPRRAVPLPLGRTAGTASYLEAQRDGTTEQVLYWTRIDQTFTTDNAGDRGALVAANLRGYLPDGVLVRLSTRTADAGAALERLRDFNERMLAGVSGAGRRLLLGAAA